VQGGCSPALATLLTEWLIGSWVQVDNAGDNSSAVVFKVRGPAENWDASFTGEIVFSAPSLLDLCAGSDASARYGQDLWQWFTSNEAALQSVAKACGEAVAKADTSIGIQTYTGLDNATPLQTLFFPMQIRACGCRP
jgi:hypothetical protein